MPKDLILVKGRFIPEFGAFKYYTTDDAGNEIYQNPFDESGNWNQNYSAENTLSLMPRANGSGVFDKVVEPNIFRQQDPIVKSFGPRGDTPRYYQTQSGLIVQAGELQRKGEQYATINSLNADCSTRTSAIDDRLIEIGQNAQKIFDNLKAITTPTEYEAARALFPILLKIGSSFLGVVVSFAATLNSREQDQNKAEMVQAYKATLANYEIEAKKLLDLKKGCAGNLSIDDLLPSPTRSAISNLSNTNLILIVAAIILLLYLYKRRKRNK